MNPQTENDNDMRGMLEEIITNQNGHDELTIMDIDDMILRLKAIRGRIAKNIRTNTGRGKRK